MGAALAAALLLGAAAGLGCGNEEGGERTASPPAARGAVTTLLPDGTVPWIDERATEQELAPPDPNRHRPSPDEAAKVKPCATAALSGELARWTRKLQRDDFGKVLGDNGLLGYVRVRNVGSASCRLYGEVPARLLAGGRPLNVASSHAVDAEARERAIAIERGEAAELRLDWSSPFCGEARGRQVLELALPENGGRLRAPVRRAAAPPCFARETEPQRRSVLSSGVFEYPRVATTLDSPLNRVRVRVTAPPRGRVMAGRDMTYHVVISNPTDAAISLRPCPAYLQSRYSTATGGRDNAVNDAQLYRLNCAPVRPIAAGGRRRFEMKVRVPADFAPGRRLSVSWGLRGRGIAGGAALEGGFELTVP
ncbi:MAG TPA: hypothetical protein VGV90_17910 [Solirubrobacteraceae bacterium]|nr:hypothetical protein [Solirubrobacteraceae bacterium]